MNPDNIPTWEREPGRCPGFALSVVALGTGAGLIAVLIWAGVQVIDSLPGQTPAQDKAVTGPVTVDKAVFCAQGQTLLGDGSGCVDIVFFEDGSWTNLHTGAHGCTPGALCEEE